MTNLIDFAGKWDFWNEKVSITSEFHCAALPCFVPGFRLAPFKIAASGARALLAMTNLTGFAGKRNGFQNETLEKRRGAAPRKKAT